MMLGSSRALLVWACPYAVDLRKGYDGLFGLTKHGLGRDPLSGELFVYLNRKRTACKVLLWDGTGLCIFQKRLERGRFANVFRDGGVAVKLTSSELSLLIEGCELVGRHALSPAQITPTALADTRPL